MLNGLVVNKIYKDCDFVHAVSARTGSLEWSIKVTQGKDKGYNKFAEI